MGVRITLNTDSFDNKVKKVESSLPHEINKALNDIANEILRLSASEVPHDTGMLQNTGHVEDNKTYVNVGYNTVYASRLHEHPEFNFQGGRKGKYLEDPIKLNLASFRVYYENAIKELFK